MDKTVEQRQAQLSSLWNVGPGPAVVNLPPTVGYANHDTSRKRNPAYSMASRYPSHLKAMGPGPIYAIKKGLTAKGEDPQLYATLKSRVTLNEKNNNNPGPAAYYPEINSNRRKAPVYSLSFRTNLNEKGKCSPGPIYLLPSTLGPHVPDKNTTGEVTIKGLITKKEKCNQNPGPIYNIGSPNLIKSKGAEVTLKGRWKPLKSQSCNAGPASYNLGNAGRRQPPAFSLGIRHSPFAGVLKTDADKKEDQVPSVDDCA